MNSARSARLALAGAGLIALSFVLFAHSALSMKQFREFVRLQEQDVDSALPPTDIIAEVFVALLLCVLGYALRFEPLKDILAAPEASMRTYDSLSAREEFYTYSHRGKAVLALRKLAGVAGPQTVVSPSASSAAKSSKKSE